MSVNNPIRTNSRQAAPPVRGPRIICGTDASGLCVFHQSFAARGLELIGGDFAIAINVNHLKVNDVRYGLIP